MTTTQQNNTYNVWTNYATWRAVLQIFTDYQYLIESLEVTADTDKFELAWQLEDYTEELLLIDCRNELTLSLAIAFINNVNFVEIAQSIIEFK